MGVGVIVTGSVSVEVVDSATLLRLLRAVKLNQC